MKRLPLTGLLLLLPLSIYAQQLPLHEDVQTIDGMMKAYYEVVSGPAGQPRQWARDSSLHHPAAQIMIVREGAQGEPEANVITLAQFHASSRSIEENGFFEYEIHRETRQFGAVAQVWSTYEWKTTMDGPVGGRGINSLSLFHDGTRWWFIQWMFDGRSNLGAIPKEYLPESEGGQ